MYRIAPHPALFRRERVSDLFAAGEKEDRNVAGAEVLVASVIPLLFPLAKVDCFVPPSEGGCPKGGGIMSRFKFSFAIQSIPEGS
ncbi:MAG: hypothetical protein U9Q76_06945 [candidate division WOR-3 bacterium]|nr:hypothetical protein [candidate division WOR-3 bacterium]